MPASASSVAHRAYTDCSDSERSLGARVATAAALLALIPDNPCSASQSSISPERLLNRSISARSSNPTISAAPEHTSTGPHRTPNRSVSAARSAAR
jgi:hypothetical protein